MTPMTLKSPAFGEGEAIPRKFTCDGADVNPPLVIRGVPKEAKSLALIVDDPDAPRGLWVHWLVWNIDPGIEAIEENSVPAGAALGTNDFDKTVYGGPCPSGKHRYFFRLYALDGMLDLAPGAEKTDLEKALEGHVLARGELRGTYTRR